MALDALSMKAVVDELRPIVTGARIEKIRQSARDQIELVLRGDRRLLLCAGTDAPRIQLTELCRETMSEPTMFCMLLRKHLTGGRIVSVDQPPMERIVRLVIDAADGLVRTGQRELVLEAMGRRSNLILLDAEGRIAGCLRYVDSSMSAARQVLPGLFYEMPPSGGRLPVTEETEDGFRGALALAPPGQTLEQHLMGRYFGLSPLLAREIAFRACGDADGRIQDLDGAGRERFASEFSRAMDDVREGRCTPYLLSRDGAPVAVSCLPLLSWGPSADLTRFPSFGALLDAFYEDRERRERARARGAELIRAATTARDRVRRKLALQEKDLAAARDRDRWRIQGDLITANLWRMERGQARLVCEDFYSDPPVTVEIPLDPLLTPQKNAANCYKRYTKARTAEEHLTEQTAAARRDLEYLESVLEELERAETEQDYVEIRRELRESGFLRGGDRARRDKREDRRLARPQAYRTSGGFRILAGRNNRQNDALTKGADRRDLWFHVQKIHGAHVILSTEGRTPEDADIREAAAVAAYRSRARESSNVPVDWCPVRNVKKPAGARPGMVVYTSYQTVYVDPALPEEREERKDRRA